MMMIASILFVLAADAVRAQETDAEKLALELGAKYVAAFEKGDADALGALYAEDAQYTVDDGETVTGRNEIRARSEGLFEETETRELLIVPDSARFVTENVMVEKGVAVVSLDGAAGEATRYSVTYVKKADGWLIADIQEASLPAPDPAAESLSTLSWMIGKWKVDSESIDAEMTAEWTLGGRFLSRTTRIRGGDEEEFVSVEVIGYDPVRGQLRSWIFDNEGGFGQGMWRADEGKWLIQITATMPEGGQSSSEHVVTLLDEDTAEMETINRILDGEALPNRDPLKVVRVTDETKAE